MAAWKLLCLQICVHLFITRAVALAPGSYYSSNGGTLNNCKIDSCAYDSCDTGKYLVGCADSSPGSCTGTCTNKPSGTKPNGDAWVSSYTSNGGNSGICNWECPDNMIKDGSTCIPSSCQITVSNIDIISTDPTVCTYQCKIGFFGAKNSVNDKGPTSCTQCDAGKYTSAANSNAACASCVAGTFANAKGSTGCKQCTENSNYATGVGQTACTNCDATVCAIGKYLMGCGSSSIGSCAGCGVPTM